MSLLIAVYRSIVALQNGQTALFPLFMESTAYCGSMAPHLGQSHAFGFSGGAAAAATVEG